MPDKTPAHLLDEVSALQRRLDQQEPLIQRLEEQDKELARLHEELKELRGSQRLAYRAQRRAEQKLRRRDEFLSLARTHGRDLLVRLDGLGRMHDLSALCRLWLGAGPKELEERSLFDWIAAEDRDRVKAFVQEVLTSDVELAIRFFWRPAQSPICP